MNKLCIEGNEILDGNKPIRLRGVNVGNMFLVEHFMIGIPWTEYKMREKMLTVLGEKKYNAFWESYLDSYFTAADAKFLAESGCNLIRLPLNYRYFHNDGVGVFSVHNIWARLDEVIGLCRQYNIYVMLDLHAAPGAQARDWNAESSFGETLLWSTKQFQDETGEILKKIALRYKDNPTVMGYDILNEPVAPDTQTYRSVMKKLIDAVRNVDPHSIIVIEPNPWGKDITSFDMSWLSDPNIMISPHHYFLQYPPFSQAKSYPVVHDGKEYTKDDFYRIFDGYWDQVAVPRPYLIGEFGVHSKFGTPQSHNLLLRDELELFESKKFHWTIWNYKDIGMMGMISPDLESPWKKFLNQPRLTKVRETVEDGITTFVSNLIKTVPEIHESAFEHFKRETVRNWHEIALEFVIDLMKDLTCEELKKFGDSWSFDSCKEVDGRFAVVRSFLK